jgi:hypothetical protein
MAKSVLINIQQLIRCLYVNIASRYVDLGRTARSLMGAVNLHFSTREGLMVSSARFSAFSSFLKTTCQDF